jgi:predicted transcriptional regulator
MEVKLTEPDNQNQDLIALTADIVSAHVSNNKVSPAELPNLIQSIHSALVSANAPAAPEPAKQDPAVSIRSSVKPDYIICLEDGAKLKMLKRYLRTRYAMSPEEYRRKWNLPADYPMVAPNYAEQRRSLAHRIGLGRKQVDEVLAEPAAVVPAKEAPKRASKANADAPAEPRTRAPRSKKAKEPAAADA